MGVTKQIEPKHRDKTVCRMFDYLETEVKVKRKGRKGDKTNRCIYHATGHSLCKKMTDTLFGCKATCKKLLVTTYPT